MRRYSLLLSGLLLWLMTLTAAASAFIRIIAVADDADSGCTRKPITAGVSARYAAPEEYATSPWGQ